MLFYHNLPPKSTRFNGIPLFFLQKNQGISAFFAQRIKEQDSRPKTKEARGFCHA
jgi:hypothetical protein